MIFLFIILMSPCRSIQKLTSPLYLKKKKMKKKHARARPLPSLIRFNELSLSTACVCVCECMYTSPSSCIIILKAHLSIQS